MLFVRDLWYVCACVYESSEASAYSFGLATNPNPTRARSYPLNINPKPDPKPDSISGPAGSGRVADLYSSDVLGLSAISLSITRSDLGLNLMGRPLLGGLGLFWMSSTSELSSSLWNDGLHTIELSLPRSAFKSFNAQLAAGYDGLQSYSPGRMLNSPGIRWQDVPFLPGQSSISALFLVTHENSLIKGN